MRIGINGFGRIGRCIFRAIFESGSDANINFIQINSSSTLEHLLHLLKYDSAHGIFKFQINKEDEKSFTVKNTKVILSSERDLTKHHWEEIDIVMECTGKLKTFEELSSHTKIGAKGVILSTMSSDENVPAFVIGANHDKLLKEHKVISIGSCTTNCLAPVAKIINDSFVIEKGFVTTVHAYTNDQSLIDSQHKDLRRSRAAAVSIIPTSTGAAKAIGKIIPDLNKKLDGSAVRVPVQNVSMIDCKFIIKKSADIKTINETIKNLTQTEFYRNAVSFCEEPLVSIDFNHNSYSSIVDALESRLIDSNLLRIVSWYDNEWGFSNRMVDTAMIMNNLWLH